MQTALLLVFLLTMLILILNYLNRSNDGFSNPTPTEKHSSFITDRLKQYNTVGVSLITADNAGALGSSTNNLTATTPISSRNNTPLNTADTGIFAISKTCESVVAAVDSVDCGIFDNPAFATNCGICLDIGTNSKGDAIPGGGLVLLAEDKENAMDKNVSNFMPKYVASVGFCPAGKMVSTKEECIKLKKQILCKRNQSFDLPGCSQCYSDGSYSIVDPTSITGHGTLSLIGSGILSIQDGTNTISNQTLSTSPYEYQLQSPEGTRITLNLSPATPASSIYIAGIISGPTFNGEFIKDFKAFVFADGSYGKPRSSGMTTINGSPATKMTPYFGQRTMSLSATVPFSFVDTTSEEASLCNTGPYATLASSASQDPCYIRGTGPGNYNLECLQNLWISNGCTQSGRYPTSQGGPEALALMLKLDGTFRTSNDIANFIYNKAVITSTGQDINGRPVNSDNERNDASLFCTGESIPTPCEGANKANGPLSVDCLNYLWQNRGVNTPSIGATYTGYGTSADRTSNPLYCQATGTYAPVNQNGVANQAIINSFWSKQGGVNAVKAVMSSIYANANAATSTDSRRLPFINQCYGPLSLANRPEPPPPAPTIYTCPTGSSAITNSPIIPRENNLIASNFIFSSNFILTVYVTINAPVSGWGSLLHFTTGSDMGPFGSRALGIWFYNGSTTAMAIHIDHSTSVGWAARENDNRGLPVPFVIGVTSKFEIICNGPQITIKLDGQTTGSFRQTGVRYSGPLSLYASNPWYPPANCSIEKVCYQALQ